MNNFKQSIVSLYNESKIKDNNNRIKYSFNSSVDSLEINSVFLLNIGEISKIEQESALIGNIINTQIYNNIRYKLNKNLYIKDISFAGEVIYGIEMENGIELMISYKTSDILQKRLEALNGKNISIDLNINFKIKGDWDKILKSNLNHTLLNIYKKIIIGIYETVFLKYDQNKKKDLKETILDNGGKFYESKNIGLNRILGFEDMKENIQKTIIKPSNNQEELIKYRKNFIDDQFIVEKGSSILFEGPSGLGKTETARAIAESLNKNMIYIDIEEIASMRYGQTENRLNKILSIGEDLGNCLIFIDEIDTFTSNRSDNNGDNTGKKILGILLKYLDGVKEGNKNLFIAATNIKDSLDKALLNRFSVTIKFEYPKQKDLEIILSSFIKNYSKDEVSELSKHILTSGDYSIRQIKNFIINTINKSFFTFKDSNEFKKPKLSFFKEEFDKFNF